MRWLTPEQEGRLVSLIRRGCYPLVAAESVGVPRRQFIDWLKRGRDQKRGRCRQLWVKVCEAQGQARALAEISVYDDDRKFWLRYGPGKERPGMPGWGTVSRRKEARLGTSGGPDRRQLLQLLGQLSRELQPFPDARAAILRFLDPKSSIRNQH